MKKPTTLAEMVEYEVEREQTGRRNAIQIVALVVGPFFMAALVAGFVDFTWWLFGPPR